MLNLRNVKKDYITSSETVHALRGISISFRKTEFVSILGPSGCGKTTLLNIVGGLDHYTDGDMIIGNRSTKEYSDRDWDVYRNHRVGFIFQSYNLIPHQTVLGNVELALTIAGIGKEERTARAKEALDRVGLSDQYYKKPNQLSGGQCQRVAIARALVNNPEILLADEPTGALDTVTSVQIMELIKEISNERLVIMVTHNPELAEQYSTRIVRLLDGEITEDTNPMTEEEDMDENTVYETEARLEKEELETLQPAERKKRIKEKKKSREKAKMSFFTAFKLSLKNLFTKKGRTTLTAFAGSIGIIGIALILAVSQGMTAYINHVQETTLSAYPLTLEATTIDASSLIESMMGKKDSPTHPNDAVYKDPIIAELVKALSEVEENKNDLAAFKTYIEGELAKEDSDLRQAITGIQYSYNLDLPIYTKNQDGAIIKSDTGELMTQMLAEFMMGMATGGASLSGGSSVSTETSGMSSAMMSSMMGLQMWQELLGGHPDENGKRPLINDLLKEQYDVVYGSWPTAKNELVLVLNENNELDDLTLYALGLLSESEIDDIIEAAVNKTPLPESNSRWSYEEICSLTFRTILPSEFFVYNEKDGIYVDASDNALMLDGLYKNALELKVVGIIRPNEDTEAAMLSGSIAYTYELTNYIITESLNSDVVKAQLSNPDYDVLTGLPFKENTGKLTNEQKKEEFLQYVTNFTDEEKAEAYVLTVCLAQEAEKLQGLTDEMLAKFETKEAIIERINAMLIESNIDPDSVSNYFEDLSLEELKTMIRPTVEEMIAQQIHQGVTMQMAQMPLEMKVSAFDALMATATDEQFALYYDEITEFSIDNYEDILIKIGCLDLDSPSAINIFASSFENKDLIVDAIANYNNSVDEEQKISYTDFIGIMMSSITTIINAITYVLIAFVAISLIVSSIMIGVITLISVQERTKEIGILRAIGASKKDVSSMFNAETIIIGLTSGLLGVGVTYLLCIPINLILNLLTGIPNLRAILPIGAAGILVLISVGLTLFSGLIPAKSAAKKDPVVALRTE